MKRRELSLLLYIADVKTNKQQEFEFVHKIFGKIAANQLVKNGFIGEHDSGVYVLTSYGAGITDSLEILSRYVAGFDRRV